MDEKHRGVLAALMLIVWMLCFAYLLIYMGSVASSIDTESCGGRLEGIITCFAEGMILTVIYVMAALLIVIVIDVFID